MILCRSRGSGNDRGFDTNGAEATTSFPCEGGNDQSAVMFRRMDSGTPPPRAFYFLLRSTVNGRMRHGSRVLKGTIRQSTGRHGGGARVPDRARRGRRAAALGPQLRPPGRPDDRGAAPCALDELGERYLLVLHGASLWISTVCSAVRASRTVEVGFGNWRCSDGARGR